MEAKGSDETGLVPGTTSKILWHFTGGPPEIDGKRDKDKKKDESKAFGILKKILRFGFLKASKETLKLKMEEDLEPKPVHSFYCCCVAEIPIQHLRYHAEWYGKSALGFRREKLQGMPRFRPVQYAFDHDDWIIYNTAILLGFVNEVFAHQKPIISLISETLERDETTMSQEKRKQLIELRNWYIPSRERAWRLLVGPEVQLRFMKSFHEEDFGTIYCEREWRMIYKQDISKPMRELLMGRKDGLFAVNELLMGKADGFKFTPKDVCFIVCPKRYVREVAMKVRQHDDFKKYFGIPVVAFEDLLEH